MKLTLIFIALSSIYAFKFPSFSRIGSVNNVAFYRGKVLAAEKVALVAKGNRIEVDEGSSMLAVSSCSCEILSNERSDLTIFIVYAILKQFMKACQKLGLKVPTDCRKGDCGTCTVTVGENKIRACAGRVPSPPKLKSIREKSLMVTVDNA